MRPALALALLLACQPARPPGWSAPEVTRLQVRVGSAGGPVRTLEGEDLGAFVACASSAQRVDPEAWKGPTHVLDVLDPGQASGRWSFDAQAGLLVRLTYQLAVYRLDDRCRSEVNGRLRLLTRKLLVDPSAKPLPPEVLKGIDERLTLGEIAARLGPAHAERGSGACIFVWRLADGREYRVGTSACDPARPPIYARIDETARAAPR